MKFDFGGWATKNNIVCSDGRTIKKDAFKHQDSKRVPLVWQHGHNDPNNVLGHAILENREEGVYAYCTFNDTEAGKQAKALVKHGDISALSIFANQLKQKTNNVLHGFIREVSLVLSPANPGALIDNIAIEHSDGSYTYDDSEAVIYTGENIELETELLSHEEDEEDEDTIEHAEEEKTVQDVFNTLTDEQKDVVYYLIGEAISDDDEEELEQSDDEEGLIHDIKGGKLMKKNVFDKEKDEEVLGAVLTHSQIKAIFDDAQKLGSLRESVLQHAGTYGIDNIDVLFPDAKTVTPTPEMISRRMEWVSGVISGTHHTPFSRIKSTAADITVEEARAKGYVTGALKKEEVFALLKRITTPTTIYKKQKLDRDDIIDITDMDVVAWLKAEMRLMLDEELARAVLVSDGRAVESEDKIPEENIRPIYKDDDMYAHKVSIAADATVVEMIEGIIRARKFYKGTGRPTFYTTADILTDMLLAKDLEGRRLYKSEAELASDLRVDKIVEVEVMEGLERTDDEEVTRDLIGIMVNLKDYSLGADKGGQVSMFDDFDIDYNQYKYLIETRCSGALTKPKSALVIEKEQAAG